jgi:hypothetical protein
VRPVWRECFRVLNSPGRLLAGFMNPDYFLFDHDAIQEGGPLVIHHRLPFPNDRNLPKEKLKEKLMQRVQVVFSHSLTHQIGGQTEAGFLIAGLYEDKWTDEATRLSSYMPTSIATLAIKR